METVVSLKVRMFAGEKTPGVVSANIKEEV